jgi:hypothetical protein
MGALNIIIGAFIMLIFLLVFMQPLMIMVDTTSTTIDSVNTVKNGRDSNGTLVAVGQAIYAPSLVVGLLTAIGFAFFLGFVIWAARGGQDPYDNFRSGGV